MHKLVTTLNCTSSFVFLIQITKKIIFNVTRSHAYVSSCIIVIFCVLFYRKPAHNQDTVSATNYLAISRFWLYKLVQHDANLCNMHIGCFQKNWYIRQSCFPKQFARANVLSENRYEELNIESKLLNCLIQPTFLSDKSGRNFPNTWVTNLIFKIICNTKFLRIIDNFYGIMYTGNNKWD